MCYHQLNAVSSKVLLGGGKQRRLVLDVTDHSTNPGMNGLSNLSYSHCVILVGIIPIYLPLKVGERKCDNQRGKFWRKK